MCKVLILYDIPKRFSYVKTERGIEEIQPRLNYFHNFCENQFLAFFHERGKFINKSCWLCDHETAQEFQELFSNLPYLLSNHLEQQLHRAKSQNKKAEIMARIEFFKTHWPAIKPRVACFEIAETCNR